MFYPGGGDDDKKHQHKRDGQWLTCTNDVTGIKIIEKHY